MSGMDDREKGLEGRYAHDQELEFKATVRRNKMLGLWAADLMGKSGDDADAYAKEVIKADFEEAGHEDVYRKVKGDLDAAGVEASEHVVRTKMDQFLAEARQQVMAEG
ncbi:DUF1476 domain-containing protein [Hyphobacterium sp. HN65]|uniref:DUF1476 domain-containing protein n=1 Tax=Hyphobacterium lacteum TaxID=3116575 RepID=A0ABU7LS38_9PROT|nr:DUF1476 domain-containing protein [Hyphobacterium sp. HN65]MEE2526154.1 DUF1476 domain-containing protein [Hyphobacterium sp. HN65]